jgi:hypothetical protein
MLMQGEEGRWRNAAQAFIPEQGYFRSVEVVHVGRRILLLLTAEAIVAVCAGNRLLADLSPFLI